MNKDEIREKLFARREIDYSRGQDTICFGEMLRAAEDILTDSPGGCVILDGRTFSRATDLEQVGIMARRLEEPLFVIQCICSDQEARTRIEADARAGRHPARNRNFDLYLEIKARQEPLPFPALHLNTDLDLVTCLSICLNYLARPLVSWSSFFRGVSPRSTGTTVRCPGRCGPRSEETGRLG